jgi:uncharacterized protein YndB with AHSA1/START domain
MSLSLEKDRFVTHSTFVIERSYPNTPERVFSAFANPAKKRRWYGESETHEVEEFEMDFRAGGIEHTRYRFKEGTPFPGTALANDGRYEDIVPNQRIVLTTAMSLGDRRISVSLITFEFVPTGKGTDLIFTHQGVFFEGSGGPEMREAGWRTLFERLSKELTRTDA